MIALAVIQGIHKGTMIMDMDMIEAILDVMAGETDMAIAMVTEECMDTEVKLVSLLINA
jgi:hypothetical protein